MSENENKVETCATTCRVRESEKAGFGGRRRHFKEQIPS